jgi:hypothetical protein
LGAMLPDLAGMVGDRPPRTEAGSLADGVAFHHQTDAAFHDAPTFRGLHDQALSELHRVGVTRGPARAVAHVGVELLLDAAFRTHIPTAEAPYRAALELGLDPEWARRIEWRSLESRDGFTNVARVLARRKFDGEDFSPSNLAARLERILAHRPRLALSSDETRRIAAWLTTGSLGVREAAHAVLHETESALDGKIAIR